MLSEATDFMSFVGPCCLEVFDISDLVGFETQVVKDSIIAAADAIFRVKLPKNI
jgi:hypothetical protein